jgi:hypothetical protein
MHAKVFQIKPVNKAFLPASLPACLPSTHEKEKEEKEKSLSISRTQSYFRNPARPRPSHRHRMSDSLAQCKGEDEKIYLCVRLFV